MPAQRVMTQLKCAVPGPREGSLRDSEVGGGAVPGAHDDVGSVGQGRSAPGRPCVLASEQTGTPVQKLQGSHGQGPTPLPLGWH